MSCSKVHRDALMAEQIRRIGPETVRTRAIAALQGGAKPPWNNDHKEIFLASWMVRERLCQELAEPGQNGGRMYVLGVQSAVIPVVKVGSSGKPGNQIREYQIQGRNWGLGLVDGWVSAPVGTRSDACRLESTILHELHVVLNGRVPGGRTFEWFHGHDFERIKTLVQHLDMLLEESLFEAWGANAADPSTNLAETDTVRGRPAGRTR
ncbi:hypothetical protein ACIPRL_34830 [Streptomyces sp. NPDC090085]|uniref:hypothetical protein n=1 Tax=Streptomyces sp. NPDC090085 TaxID=3365943 RepID=UPI0037F5A976